MSVSFNIVKYSGDWRFLEKNVSAKEVLMRVPCLKNLWITSYDKQKIKALYVIISEFQKRHLFPRPINVSPGVTLVGDSTLHIPKDCFYFYVY